MASSLSNWRQGSGRTPRFNFAFLTFLLEEDVAKRAANDFNPERYNYNENTALLRKYWCMPGEKRMTIFQLLYLLGGDPRELPDPVVLTKSKYNKSLTEDEITAFSNFLQQAQTAFNEERGIHAQAIRDHTNQEVDLKKNRKRKLDESAEPPARKIVALSLATGGSRSMIAALMLRFVSNRSFGDESIVERIDWIAGASMGSVFAINLIKEPHMKPSDCINFFWSLYGSNDPALRSGPGKTGRFESFLRNNFDEITMGTRMARSEDNGHIPKVCLTSTIVSPAPAEPYNHKNFNRGFEMCSSLSLRGASRASSADPTHFDPFSAGQRLFISAGPPCNTPVGELISEIDKYSSPPMEIAALLSIETGKNLDFARKVRWYGFAQNAIRNASNNQGMLTGNAFEVDEQLIDIMLNPRQDQIETALCDQLNPPGALPRYLRLNPPLPNPNTLAQPDWYRLNSLQYKKITNMWHALLYLTQPNTLAIIDDFQRAYKFSI